MAASRTSSPVMDQNPGSGPSDSVDCSADGGQDNANQVEAETHEVFGGEFSVGSFLDDLMSLITRRPAPGSGDAIPAVTPPYAVCYAGSLHMLV